MLCACRWAAVVLILAGGAIEHSDEHSDAFSFLQNSQIHMDFIPHRRLIQKLHLIGSLSLAQHVITQISICKMTPIGMMRKRKGTS